MTELEIASNEITNHGEKILGDAELTLTDHCKQTEIQYTQSVSAKIQNQQNDVVTRIKQVQKKYSNSPEPQSIKNILISNEVSGIIDDEINLIFSFGATAKKNASDNIFSFTQRLIESAKAAFNAIVNTIKSIYNFVGAALTAITNLVTNFIANIANKLMAIANGAVNLINNLINKAIGAAMGLLKSFNKLINLPGEFISKKIKQFKKITANFQAVDKGLASVSAYIQANVPNSKGIVLPNPKALLNTPDFKIVIPKLKVDLNVVKQIDFNKLIILPKMPDIKGLIAAGTEAVGAGVGAASSAVNALMNTQIPPLSSLIPAFSAKIVPSLLPKKLVKKIEEPKPTGKDAEYGSCIASVTPAGNTQITDDTPGNERTIDLHPSGSYDQKLANGDNTAKITGKQILIIDKNWELTVGQDQIVIVSGDQKIEVRHNKIEDIADNFNLVIGGEKTTIVGQTVCDDFKDSYLQKVGIDQQTDIANDASLKVGNDYAVEVDNDMKETVRGNLTIHCSGNVNIVAGGNANLTSAGIIRIKGKKVKIG